MKAPTAICEFKMSNVTNQILINDPYYPDRTTLDVYDGKVIKSVLFEASNDLNARLVLPLANQVSDQQVLLDCIAEARQSAADAVQR